MRLLSFRMLLICFIGSIINLVLNKRMNIQREASTNNERMINRIQVLELIRLEISISQTQIAHKLNIKLSSVSRIIKELLKENLVIYSRDNRFSQGKSSSLIEFNGEAYNVISIDLGGSKIFGSLIDLVGKVQYEIILPTRDAVSKEPVENLFKVIDILIDLPQQDNQKLRGISIGAPGFTQVPEGIIIFTPNLDSMVCIVIGTDIGAGIVLNSKLYRGCHQVAGEIGYLFNDISSNDYDKVGIRNRYQ
jgi:glucokinase